MDMIRIMQIVQPQFIPALMNRLPMDVDVSVDVVGESVNIIIHQGNVWLQEFAILTDDLDQVCYCPVYRV